VNPDPLRQTCTLAGQQGGHEVARNYWTNLCADAPELLGVAGIGGAGLTEVLYRHHEELLHLQRILTIDSQKTVLELGSGNGRWAISLAPMVKHYVAVDFSTKMNDIARARAARFSLKNIDFCEASILDYTPTMNFDVIYLSGVSQYIHNDDLLRLLERLIPFMNPGAVVVDRSTVHLHQRQMLDEPDYFSIYRTADEIVGMYREAGLESGYQKPSYRILNFPYPLQWVLTRRYCSWLVAATAPMSFGVLRAMACAGSVLFKPRGEARDYSHYFFVFHQRKCK